MELEHRSVRLMEMRSGEAPGAFSGYGAVFGNRDAYGDVIQAGAFRTTLQEWRDERGKWPPMLLQHGGTSMFGGGAEDLLPIGQWTSMEENAKGLKVSGQLFALETEKGQYIYAGLKSGALDGLSIGFKTRQKIDGTKPDDPRRTLTDLDLWEVSVVTFPANARARVTGVKSFTVEELRDLEGALRDSGLSRAHSVRAIAVFKQRLQPDAGAEPAMPQGDPDAGDVIMSAADGLLSQILGATFAR